MTSIQPARSRREGTLLAGMDIDQLATLGTGLVLIFGLWIVFLLAGGYFQIHRAMDPRASLALADVIGLLIPAIVAAVALRRFGMRFAPPTLARASLRANVWDVVSMGLSGSIVASGSNAVVVSWLHATGWPFVRRLEDFASALYAPVLKVDGPVDTIVLFLLAGVLAAACEEVAFRRVLQGLFSSTFPGAVAIGMTAILFSAFHVEPLGFPSRVFLGVSMGVVYHRTGSVLAAAIVHGLHNVLALAMLTAGGAQEQPQFLDGTLRLYVAALAVVAFLAWLIALARIPPREPRRLAENAR